MWRGRSWAFSGIGLQKQVWWQLEGGLGGCQGWKMLSQSENFIIAIAMIHMLIRYWCFDQRIVVNIASPLVLPWAWTDWILKLWWSCLPTSQKPSQRTKPRACCNSYFRFFSKMLPPVKSPDEVADDDHEDGKTENRCVPQFQDSAAITW